jgi:hypothetical protein
MFGLLAIGGWSLVIAAAVAAFVSMVVGAASGATRNLRSSSVRETPCDRSNDDSRRGRPWCGVCDRRGGAYGGGAAE